MLVTAFAIHKRASSSSVIRPLKSHSVARVRRALAQQASLSLSSLTTSYNMSATEVSDAPATPTVAASIDLFHDVDDPENYLVVHELLGRGHLLNAYEVSDSATSLIESRAYRRSARVAAPPLLQSPAIQFFFSF